MTVDAVGPVPSLPATPFGYVTLSNGAVFINPAQHAPLVNTSTVSAEEASFCGTGTTAGSGGAAQLAQTSITYVSQHEGAKKGSEQLVRYREKLRDLHRKRERLTQ